MTIAFFGSSLVSAYWNGAATYYRGMLQALAAHGHRITFYEPDAFDRQKHRDIPDPDWARVVVYPATRGRRRQRRSDEARDADLLVKASGVGVFDALLEARVPATAAAGRARRVLGRRCAGDARPDRAPIPRPVSRADPALRHRASPMAAGRRWSPAYRSASARACCVPIYNGLDPATHHPAAARAALCLRSRPRRQPAARPRAAHRRVLPRGRRRTARPPISCSAAPAGATSRCRANVGYLGHVYTRRSQRLQRLGARGAERQPRQHGALTATARRRACSRPPAPAPA